MKFSLQYGSGVVALPEKAMDYLDKADPLTLKLLLHLAAERELLEAFDTAEFAKRFAVTVKEIEAALAFWQNAGLLTAEEDGAKPSQKKRAGASVSRKTAENGESVTVVSSDMMPHYTGSEIERIINENQTLAQLIDECQAVVGKMFGQHELNRVIGMADVLGFDHDAILLLFGFAKSIDKCSVNYVVKIAEGLAADGRITFPEVEAYIAAKEKAHSVESLIRRLGGLGARAFSAKESRFIAAWSEYEFTEDILTLAYDITVDNAKEFSFPYMNKILVSWHEEGYKTKAEIEEALAGFRNKKGKTSDTSFDVDEFFEAALKRSQNRTTGTPK